MGLFFVGQGLYQGRISTKGQVCQIHCVRSFAESVMLLSRPARGFESSDVISIWFDAALGIAVRTGPVDGELN